MVYPTTLPANLENVAISIELSSRLAAILRQRYNPTVIATTVCSGDACPRNRKITGAPGHRHCVSV